MKQTKVYATSLTEDDHFELAGEMYRIEAIRKDYYDNRIITAYPQHGDPVLRIIVTVPSDTPFTIFNQQ